MYALVPERQGEARLGAGSHDAIARHMMKGSITRDEVVQEARGWAAEDTNSI
jgi:hypothetical protein